MAQSTFVIEGEVAIGPYRYPIFVDDRVLGALLIEHFQPREIGNFHRIGRARIIVDLLEEE